MVNLYRFLCGSLCMGAILLSSCASNPYQYGVDRHGNQRARLNAEHSAPIEQQVYIGRSNWFLDAAGWIWPPSLVGKLLLWNKNVDNHKIRQNTLDALTQYLHDNQLQHVQVLANSYHPRNQFRRLNHNRTVHWFIRYTAGLLSVLQYTLVPGRFFGGDAYNPYTDTIYLYSDDIAIALHEAGHAKDQARRTYKGLYSLTYMIPGVNLYREAAATSDALGYLYCQQRSAQLGDAYKTLYPAWNTYLGSYWTKTRSDRVGSLVAGHIISKIVSSRADDGSDTVSRFRCPKKSVGTGPDSSPTDTAGHSGDHVTVPVEIDLQPAQSTPRATH